MRTSTSNHYYLLDGLGSVAAITDINGNVAATYGYEPFGKVKSQTGTLQNPYRWLGALGVYFDSSTGLYKMGTRYYDPALGRFTQVDPVPGGSANRYDYAVQDPVNFADPRGTRVLPNKCVGGVDLGFNRKSHTVSALGIVTCALPVEIAQVRLCIRISFLGGLHRLSCSRPRASYNVQFVHRVKVTRCAIGFWRYRAFIGFAVFDRGRFDYDEGWSKARFRRC
jgi:RHS repeat-associated protein